MKSIVAQLRGHFAAALEAILGAEGSSVDPLIRAAADEKFGDYQSNLAMGLGKRLNLKPRDVAQKVVDHLPPAFADLCEPCEIAGPGFINIRLKSEGLAAMLSSVPAESGSDRLGIEPTLDPMRVVVDYSGPNVAKQLHVGHIRSTIIGDSIARVLGFQGHDVIRQNHIGDWGTQFGMLIALLKEKMPRALTEPDSVHVADLETFYREASERDKADQAFHEQARREVVALHQRDPETMRAWGYIVEESRRHYLPLYERLGVSLTREDERGESFYADRLEQLVADFQRQFARGHEAGAPPASGLPAIQVVESDGALCVFHTDLEGNPLFKNAEGEPFPMIIRKSDGAFIYATTDLAALDFRLRELNTQRIIYVTDARQVLHFQMLFATARAAGWTVGEAAPGEAQLEHVTFGSILGANRRPFASRDGTTIKLADLLDEAVARAEAMVRESEADEKRRRGFSEAEIREVAEAVGIGAVKYADLSQNRQSDYVFSWDRMLAMEGNTAPYLMYAYARVRAIYRKGDASAADLAGEVILTEPAERQLGRQILRFPETLDAAGESLKLNLLTDYLYELAACFMRFYESCPVLNAENPQARTSRLRLCDLTARALRLGLGLLGIRTLERM